LKHDFVDYSVFCRLQSNNTNSLTLFKFFCFVFLVQHNQILIERYFWGGFTVQYFIVQLHWMCTKIRRRPHFPLLLMLSKGTFRVPHQESNPGPTERQAGMQSIEHRLTPPLSYSSPPIELRLTPNEILT